MKGRISEISSGPNNGCVGFPFFFLELDCGYNKWVINHLCTEYGNTSNGSLTNGKYEQEPHDAWKLSGHRLRSLLLSSLEDELEMDLESHDTG